MTPLALPQQRLPVSPSVASEASAAGAAGTSPCPLPFPVEAEGRLRKANAVFVKVYLDMVQSGLLAELSGTELKVLLALGLVARRLGGDVAAEHHFERLKSLAVVTEADRGRLFCYLARDTIAAQTGLSTRTVSTAGNALVSRHLLEKRSVRNHSGRHDYNVYFILPASRLGKFDFNRRPSLEAREPGPDRGKNLPTVEAMGKEPPAVRFPHVKKTSGHGVGVPVETTTAPSASPPDQWEAAMESAVQRVRQAGWPVDENLRTALRAKALRMDDEARRQGADGPGWVADATLVTLGRKVGKKGRQIPDDEELLAYADGILANWARRGGRRAPGEMPSRPTPDLEAVASPPQCLAEFSTPLLLRQPKSEEQQLWGQILEDLRGQMPRETFNLWLSGSELLQLHRPDDGLARLVVRVSSQAAVDWLEHRLIQVIRRTVRRWLGREADLTFQTHSQISPHEARAGIT